MNPLALLAALIPSSIAVILWLNPWSSAGALVGWLLVALWIGWIRRLTLPVLGGLTFAALTAAVSMALYGQSSGQVLWEFGPAQVSTGSLEIAFATAIRLLALAVPAVLVFQEIDLTRLADAFEQTLRWSPRVVWGGFAGLRQIELAQSDWQVVSRARRARGIDTPWRGALVRLYAMFALAIERGGELAVTLEARAIARSGRVPTRPIAWRRRESWCVLAGVLFGVLIGWVAVNTGGSLAN